MSKFVLIKPKLNPNRKQREPMYRGTLYSQPMEMSDGSTAAGITTESETQRRVLIKRGWIDVTDEYNAKSEPVKKPKAKKSTRKKPTKSTK